MPKNAQSVLVKYFKDLEGDVNVAYPTLLGDMPASSIDFELSQLYQHIHQATKCRNPFIVDAPENEVLRLLSNPSDDIRVSALLTIISIRLPHLGLRSRV